MGTQSIPGVKCGRGVLLTTHAFLVPRSWKSKSIPLPLYPTLCFVYTEKLIDKDGVEWCADVLDKFVLAEQSVEIGETVVRRYTPACPSQRSIVINIYSADSDNAQVRNLNLCQDAIM